MARVELTNGGWAELREPAAVSVRLRRPIERALLEIARSDAMANLENPAEIASNMDSASFDKFTILNDLLIVARVESWSFEKVINLDTILDLPGADYKILQEATADGVTEMLPDFAISDDKDSPINPSDA